MQGTYDKYQMDFAQHLKRHDVIVGEIEGTELELNDLAKQQGESHQSFDSDIIRVFHFLIFTSCYLCCLLESPAWFDS